MHLCIGWELCHKFCSTPWGQLVRALLHKTWKISEEWIWIILYRRKTSLNSIAMIKPFREQYVWGDSFTGMVTQTWTVTMNCLQSIHKDAAWFIPQQPVTYKDDNLAAVKVETSNLSILFWAILFEPLWPKSAPPFFPSLFWNRLQRRERRMEARLLAEAEKADVL